MILDMVQECQNLAIFSMLMSFSLMLLIEIQKSVMFYVLFKSSEAAQLLVVIFKMVKCHDSAEL
jgi:hypothetical protein